MPNEALSEQLHAQLDAMGAPPRDPATIPAETLDDSQTTGGENLSQGEAMSGLDDGAGEIPEGVIDTEAEVSAAESGTEVATTGESQKFKPAELAEAIGWEAKDLYDDLMIPVGHDGETQSLGAIKDRVDTIAASEAEINSARADLQARYEQLHAHQQQLTQGFAGVSEEVDNASASWLASKRSTTPSRGRSLMTKTQARRLICGRSFPPLMALPKLSSRRQSRSTNKSRHKATSRWLLLRISGSSRWCPSGRTRKCFA